MTSRSENGVRIAVIGGGVSGVLTAIHLLWRCQREDRVYLVEKSAKLGPGVAYGTRHPLHLANIRAENMSAFADEPDHFVKWLGRLPEEERAKAGCKTMAGLFVRREIYGRYIQELLHDTIIRQGGSQNLFIVIDTATALRQDSTGLALETEVGRTYEVDAAVLAIGNFPPGDQDLPGYVNNPWAEDALDGLHPGLPVVIIGTGLTAVDVMLMLQERGFDGPIQAFSRHGLLPQAHAPSSPWSGFWLDADDRRSLVSLTRAVRREVRRAAAVGVGWRCVVDALRPEVQSIWTELSMDDRRRFVHHLRPYWESHRHRMAPPIAEAVAAMRKTGQLQIVSGRINSIEPERNGLHVHWRSRGGAVGEILAQRVVDCRGPGTDYTRLRSSLTQQMLVDGLARPDACRLGLEATTAGALVGGDGLPSSVIFGVGPVTRGTFWEITSVPDIREQAEAVAVSALAAARDSRPFRVGAAGQVHFDTAPSLAAFARLGEPGRLPAKNGAAKALPIEVESLEILNPAPKTKTLKPQAFNLKSPASSANPTITTAEEITPRSEAGFEKAIAERRAEANRRAQRRAHMALCHRRSAR
ncbi:MAG: FAD/NAD(P)-binding protein [Acetobacteraceae bacterium]|nr:FAD/NAD(P)-binding protein [Acetobacteraceae bacterium]